MDKRAQYLIQILDKIGSPLMSAIIAASDNDNAEGDAQSMAEMLGKSVELSISMANIADLNDVENDSVRVALTALASPLIGALHRESKQTPGENDLKRIASALQAVLTFSENFTPDDDNTKRLETLETNGTPLDAHQMTLQYMYAFVPAVNAVGAFPFGQPEQKLIMEVASKITARAQNLRSGVLGDLPEAEQKPVDLAILKSLAVLYADCHNAETKRLSESGAENGGLDEVWRNFDLRVSMLEALAGGLLPGGPKIPVAAVPEDVSEPELEDEDEEIPKPPKAAPPKEEPKSAPPAGNPMAMFAKKPGGDDDKTDPPPPAAAPEDTPEPPATDPSEDSDETDTGSSSDDTSGSAKGSGGGSPMSFFKKSD
ncbi:MAG: hypothetical protein KDJ35_04515 [Alphaproteobacteria bacterium]|nr:hypothetical protein [Alphaproteobacteria bacterium]